jgi:release factor glutamine methyltransferase
LTHPPLPSSFVIRLSSGGDALAAAERALASTDSPALTAQALLAHVTGLTRTQVLARPEIELTPEQQRDYEALVARAAAAEPLAYLTGEREFYGLPFWVDRHVLVPRPESELLVDLGKQAGPRRVLDVGTGSGCLAVSLAVALPRARVTALDSSPEALALARRNAARHQVDRRVTFIHSDLLAACLAPRDPSGPPSFDLIVANLPYIDTSELRGLDVARFEPWAALDGGPGGLRVIERFLSQAPPFLAPGGTLLLEIGATQGVRASALARAAFPQAAVALHQDFASLDRVVALHVPASA